jgi:hypothetical protein
MNELSPLKAESTAHLHPRIVPWRHAFAWYEEAMRLLKRAPMTWVALAIATIMSELLLKAIPGAGSLLSEAVTPLVTCGLFYAGAETDRGTTPSLLLAVRAFRAPLGAIAAVIVSALLTLGAEAFAAWWIADVNLFDTDNSLANLSTAAITGIHTIGILASLPVMFVAFHVLFEKVEPRAAFVASWRAFVLNTLPLLVYGAASLVLLGFGLLTLGFGLVIALPLWAASSYAAWKDIFGVRDPPEVS